MPRGIPNKEFDAASMDVGQPGVVEIPLEGDVERPKIEVQQGPYAMEKAAAMAFNEEPVTVMIHESTDENAENPVQVCVQGRNQFFFRGRPQTVKRKYLEVLARAKGTRYSQRTDGTAEQQNQMHGHAALKYPFTVIEDRNPKGPAWLKHILEQVI